jgi:hypothetical protein
LFLEKVLSVLPRKGWREEVERDVQVTEVWRVLVIDREKLRVIVQQAKAHNGP